MKTALIDDPTARIAAAAAAYPSPYVPPDELIALHAGGVSSRGRGLVLPAVSESGKSTLTAGLVRAGFEYLSDEAVQFRWGETMIVPYPKPLHLDPGCWHLFPELRGVVPSDALTQWVVHADDLRPDSVGQSCPATWLVFPTYREGAATRLDPITKGEALVEACKNTFRFNVHGRRALDALTVLVRACSCYRLINGDLDDAITVLEQLTAAPSATSR